MEHQTDSDYLQKQVYDSAYDLDVRTHILSHYLAHAPNWYDWLFEQLTLPECGRILELGCGPGDLWQQNRSHLRLDGHVCLSDLSPGMVQAARRRLGHHMPPFSFAVLDVTALPFAENRFDVVLAFGLLDHLADTQQALTEVQRVLRPNGLFYTSAGGSSHLHQLESLIKPFLPEANYGGDSNQFGLRNGARLLAPFFREVQQQPYENALIFRDPVPLAAYILSEPEIRQQLSAARLAAFQRHIRQEIEKSREMRITIKKGLFIGKRG